MEQTFYSGKEYLLVKNTLDIFFGFICLVIFIPVIAVIAILVRIDSKGNPIFTQRRVGKHGRIFLIYKIRTLYVEHFGIFPDQNEPSDYRITRLGKYLRRSKLDELPQLLNIALGQMSFVGPRPMAYDYVKIVGIRTERLAVKPGLTGVTQVSGNLQLSWDDRILLDIWYVKNCSGLVDFKILIATVLTLIHGERVDKDYLKVHGQLTDKNKNNRREKMLPALQLSSHPVQQVKTLSAE